MNTFKGTPGPWTTHIEGKQMAVVANNRMVAEVPRQPPDAARNLLAIAAVPDMIEALQQLIREAESNNEYYCDEGLQNAVASAKAALSKALD
jgi:hypothetical protein